MPICDRVNKIPGNKTNALVDEKDFIWIKDAAWSEVIGLDTAQKRLEETIGPLNENSYNLHCQTVHAFLKNTNYLISCKDYWCSR